MARISFGQVMLTQSCQSRCPRLVYPLRSCRQPSGTSSGAQPAAEASSQRCTLKEKAKNSCGPGSSSTMTAFRLPKAYAMWESIPERPSTFAASTHPNGQSPFSEGSYITTSCPVSTPPTELRRACTRLSTLTLK